MCATQIEKKKQFSLNNTKQYGCSLFRYTCVAKKEFKRIYQKLLCVKEIPNFGTVVYVFLI